MKDYMPDPPEQAGEAETARKTEFAGISDQL